MFFGEKILMRWQASLHQRHSLECNKLPTQHICSSCSINYVCDICSQRRGVPEGIFRCHKCAPNTSNDLSIDADINGITTSWTHISIQPSSINNIDTQVDNDDPKEGNHTIPEGKESVVAEKSDNHHLKPSSGDDNGIDTDTSRTHISIQHGLINNIDTQVNDNDPKEDNHTSPFEKAPVVAEKSQGDEMDEFDIEVKHKPKQFNNKLGKNAIVSVLLKNIIPVSTIKEMYPNNYQETRCKFIVGKIKKHEN